MYRENGILEIRLAEGNDRRTPEKKKRCEETCTITINVLELLGMVVTAWIMFEVVGDRLDADGDRMLMRGYHKPAVSWVI